MAKLKTPGETIESERYLTYWRQVCGRCHESRAWHGPAGAVEGAGPLERRHGGRQCPAFEQPKG